eukprot:PhF_6_TR20818/c0_g1_i3/m.29956/K08517/SEC22; vesicle transport protein SEC22
MLLTLIARATDGLALAADTSDSSSGSSFPDLDKYKFQAKNLIRRLTPGVAGGGGVGGGAGGYQPPVDLHAMTITNDSVSFHVLKESGVFFLTMSESAASAAVAFAYLEDISKEFLTQHGSQVDAAQRPYCFIRFDMFLQKTKRVYANPTQRAMASQPTKYTIVRQSFNEVMGYVQESNSGVGKKGENTIVIIVVAFAAAISVLLIVLWLTSGN